LIQSESRPFNFLGLPSEYSSFEKSKVVILPVPYKSANTPHEIISASRNVELYDEELGKETYKIGIHTLEKMVPEVENADAIMEKLYKVSQQILQAGKFQVTLCGEHSITSVLVKAHLEKWPSMAVLQIDADTAKLRNNIFYRKDIKNDPEWFVKVVDELPEHVYFTIDIDGMNPDELTWRDLMNLTRELTHRRNVVGVDLVGLYLQEGQAFYCAKLLYKILGLIFNR
jgi:N1-aminopropylagmatine ureohydrolase